MLILGHCVTVMFVLLLRAQFNSVHGMFDHYNTLALATLTDSTFYESELPTLTVPTFCKIEMAYSDCPNFPKS